MNQATRKERSFEQIQGEQGTGDDASTRIEIETGIFISTKGVKDLVNPTDEELFRLAGGTLDMKNLGKKGIDLRTILAQRVSSLDLHLTLSLTTLCYNIGTSH